jgi:hypothetical protein
MGHVEYPVDGVIENLNFGWIAQPGLLLFLKIYFFIFIFQEKLLEIIIFSPSVSSSSDKRADRPRICG